ncbi:hypothetical protein D9611_014117 [Ephemerocybe angulata]|uniref:Uncharacterized protein n=1 Tax=Ephemerocybe angulata TaxID=980116 RepID=A0A8H5B9E6_9AGAR|nr:hypothetical protein D9611_014117 [Tulosesus angulatus]
MAASSSSHYIRTIHTSFTAAHSHSNPWARTPSFSLSPSLSPSPSSFAPSYPQHQHQQQQQHQKYTAQPASGAGGRRRAYAFRVAPQPQRPGTSYKFDPFADEPTAPVPSIAHLASLSAPPTPRLAAASLPPPAAPYPHYAHAAPHPAQRARQSGVRPEEDAPAARDEGGADARTHNRDLALHLLSLPSPSTTSPIPRGRALNYEFEEYDYDSTNGGHGGLIVTGLRRPSPSSPSLSSAALSSAAHGTGTGRESASMIQPRAQAMQPVRAAVRTPSPPAAPAPGPRGLNDKDAKAKLVAGILLNRIHAGGRRARRVPSPSEGGRVYVPNESDE